MYMQGESKTIDPDGISSLARVNLRAGLSLLDWLSRTPLQMLYDWLNVDFSISHLRQGACITLSPAAEKMSIQIRWFQIYFEQELIETFNGTLNDVRLHLDTEVQNIDYSGNSVKITTNKGIFEASKHVIVTFKIGVLQDNRVTWTPRLLD